MRNIQKKYDRTKDVIEYNYFTDLSSLSPDEVAYRLEVLGCEHLPTTITSEIEIKKWLIDMFSVPIKPRKKKPKHKKRKLHGFYGTDEWRELRVKVFNTYGKKCLRCGAKKNLHVDHIFPRSRYKYLELDFDNLQPLCKTCNELKLNRFYWDYRTVSNTEKLKLLAKVGCDDLNISAPDRR